MLPRWLSVPAGLGAFVTPVLAQLPYNPTRIFSAHDGAVAYIFSPQPSSFQFSLSSLNTSDGVNSSSPRSHLSSGLPFLSNTSAKPFTAVADDDGISVLTGDCQQSASDVQLWRLTYNQDVSNGTWSTLTLATSDNSLNPKYLASGFTFSPTASTQDASFYVFGGMCPNQATEEASTWVSDATYSNTMLTLASNPQSNHDTPYQLSLTGARAPPIAEAGLSITPLTPTFSNTSDGSRSQQQNFVLLGGHTQSAFINMSQLALFSLPQESWAFVGVSQPSSSQAVEPRSGHSAILTEDGSKIVVVGGWVGDVNTPAQPQLAILEVGQGYGGQADWVWTIPTSHSNPFTSTNGLYGHGAVMLPGGTMMISGGYPIGSFGSKQKRQLSTNLLFLNTTTFEWTDSYTSPYPPGTSRGSASVAPSSTGLKASEKAGLGAGLGLGIAAAAGVAIVWLIYSRRLRTKRAIREKELRELALGAERYTSPVLFGDGHGGYAERRSASWAAAQEHHIESSGKPFPWAPVVTNQPGRLQATSVTGDPDPSRYVERTGAQMEIPSPTRGLRKSLSNRVPAGYGPFNQHPPSGPGAVFRIEEEDEGSHSGSLKRSKTPRMVTDRGSVASDPFKDPLDPAESAHQANDAAQRKKEVEVWVEDWQSAAEDMSISRSTSQAHSRTYSNLSQFRSAPHSGDGSGRGSPEKSDRTGSNLSENSVASNSSFQRSIGTLSRNISQRSVSAGYALFSGAAAAMGRMGSGPPGQNEQDGGAGLARAPSNRSVSLNLDLGRHAPSRDDNEPFSSARQGWGGLGLPAEDHSLLYRNPQRAAHEARDYRTLPESPSKDKYARAGSLTGSGRKAMDLLGSVRRVFTGTGNVDVHDRAAAFENSSAQSSPTKYYARPEMVERTPSAGASFWRSKQGARDWENDLPGASTSGPYSTTPRKPVPGVILNDNHGALDDDDEGDWDVETAVQKRVVQVMFTVPKEKLRVVNADALSLLSSNRSEADQDEDKERQAIKRMSSLNEETPDFDDDMTGSKGKARAP